MQISPAIVALPNFYCRVPNRVPLTIENSSTQIRDLAHTGSQLVIDDQEIVVRIQRQLVRIKRPLGLGWRLHQLLGKHPGNIQRRSKGGRAAQKQTTRQKLNTWRGHEKFLALFDKKVGMDKLYIKPFN